MPTPRRGRHRRLVSRCRVELDHASGADTGETEDVSPTGLYVRTEMVLPVGDELDVRMELPDGSIVALYARVAHRLSPNAARALGRHVGMGLELIGPETPAREKLVAHIEAVRSEQSGVVELTNPGRPIPTHVIIAEPSRPMRERMSRCLETAGFHVTAVESAMLALDAGTAIRPHAVIAAAEMPAMTGVDLAYAMAEHSSLSDVPLVLTGDDDDHGRLEAFRAGIRDYIPLPFLDDELVIRIQHAAIPPPIASPGLRGSLVDIALGTLLSLLEFERKSGVLLVVHAGELARVFVSDGKVVEVETSGSAPLPSLPTPGVTGGRSLPKDRLMRLLDWEDGQFEFTPAELGGRTARAGRGRDDQAISVTQILLEHARLRDEQRAQLRDR